ncbi:DUF6134 family protein [Thalassospiraceae bacterium LMO-JJ14]|nr:DUF6134 family protein [Thalassospiraceae bacterium LMO-JJ14]
MTFAVPVAAVLMTVPALPGHASINQPWQDAPARATVPFDPIEAYGEEIIFDVYRKGERIGSHTVQFVQDDALLTVTSLFDISIRLLGLSLYAYSYTSRGSWRHGELVAIEAETNDDGTVSRVVAGLRDDAPGESMLSVSGPDSQSQVPAGIYPTTHWNPGVIGATKILNTITGHANTVSMSDLGVEVVETGGAQRRARHYAYRGELENHVWYDSKGRWVKMRFPGKDGIDIEYRCRKCGADIPPHHSETNAGHRQTQGQASR